ncbi:phosphoglycerate kinase [Pseudomonas aeruginosa]|nr:phosphoglycerate kinase [Pseudomonas aeruginosa]
MLIREDLNVPVKDGQGAERCTDQGRPADLKLALEEGRGGDGLLHLGRPTEGEFSAENSLKPVAEYLSKAWAAKCRCWPTTSTASRSRRRPGAVRNVRFNKGEEER